MFSSIGKTDYILSIEHLFWVKVRAMSNFENVENEPLFWMKTQRISFQLKIYSFREVYTIICTKQISQFLCG